MKKTCLNIEDIFNIPTAVIYNPDSFKPIYDVSTDSRDIKKNTLFIALKGERFDGHDFINDVVKSGAAAVMIDEKKFPAIDELDIPVITVKNTTRAFGDTARLWRNKLKAKVIALTGSAGKTTTKEILAVLLSQKFNVNKTSANNNNHIGVPLTVLSTNQKHNVLVAELGTNHFGEIAYTSSIVLPDYAVITNIGDSHLEFLKNRKGVLKEKSALLKETVKHGGKIFINNDDALLKEFGKKIKNKVTYSVNAKADYTAKIKSYDKLARPLVEIRSKKKIFKAALPISGEKNVLNFTCAYAIASELGVSDAQILKSVKKIKAFNKRLEIKNKKSITLINDTYNANPDSMKSSISILSNIKTQDKRIAVLGDMFELGKQSKAKHLELASFIKNTDVDEVYTIGTMMKLLDNKLKGTAKTHQHFTSREALKDFLKSVELKNSVILVKGSRGMKMEEFVTVIESKLN